MGIPKSNCHACKHLLWDDTAKTPNVGDQCICIYCGFINEFDSELQLIRPKICNPAYDSASLAIKLATLRNCNPFKGEPDKFGIKKLLGFVEH